MNKSILTFGAIAGVVVAVPMFLGLAWANGGDAPRFSEWLGYLIMIVAFSIIFVGIKRYRDHDLGGVIRFGTALLLGLGITAIASVVYVVGWEITLSLTDHAFIEEYTTSIIDARKADGVSGDELDAVVASMDEMKERYAKPLYRLPITFLEIFPVGLVITLLSAAILRNSKVLPAAT